MKIFIKKSWFLVALVAAAAIYTGCNKKTDIRTFSYPAPLPEAMSPSIDYAGRLVTITGSSFGDYKNVVKVYFNGILADTVISCEDTKIVVKVPDDAITGKVSLQVWTNKVDSIGTFTVVPLPTAKIANPNTGLPGDTVRIYGTGYGTDITKVKVNFNGTPADVAFLSDTMITTTVPVGSSSGNIGVSVNDYAITGPGYSLLVAVPTPRYQLDFEGDLKDKISGVAAIYNKGLASDTSFDDNGISGRCIKLAGYSAATWTNAQSIAIPAAVVAKQKEITVACWVNWSSARAGLSDPIFDFGETRSLRYTLVARMSGGTWGSTNGKVVGRYILNGKVPVGTPGAWEDFTTGNVLTPNTWTHVAFTLSYANLSLQIYMDGKLVNTKVLSRSDVDPALMNINKAYIGASSYGSGTEPAFGGMIDKFQVWNSILSADQIYTLYFKK